VVEAVHAIVARHPVLAQRTFRLQSCTHQTISLW
jgi:hypothetical protein